MPPCIDFHQIWYGSRLANSQVCQISWRSMKVLILWGIKFKFALSHRLGDHRYTCRCVNYHASCDNTVPHLATSGVRQGCVLAPALFIVTIDWILGHLAPEVGITVGQYHFTDLAYADDAILMSDQLQADSVLQSFNAFDPCSTGLTVIMVQNKTPKRG